jgi:hypothetical protein
LELPEVLEDEDEVEVELLLVVLSATAPAAPVWFELVMASPTIASNPDCW